MALDPATRYALVPLPAATGRVQGQQDQAGRRGGETVAGPQSRFAAELLKTEPSSADGRRAKSQEPPVIVLEEVRQNLPRGSIIDVTV